MTQTFPAKFKINFPGFNGVGTRLGFLVTGATLAEATAAGFLNPYMQSENFSIQSSDFIFVVASNGSNIYQPVIAAGTGIVTLTALGVS
jgi:hypothetical protein